MEGEDLLGADRCLRGVGARLVVGIRPALCRNLRAEVATSKRSGVTSAFPNIPCYYIRTNFFLLIYSAYVGGGKFFFATNGTLVRRGSHLQERSPAVDASGADDVDG